QGPKRLQKRRAVGLAILISVPGPLVFSYGGATLRLEQERNGSNVRERFRGIVFAGAPGNSAGPLPAGRRLHALHGAVATKVIVLRCRRIFSAGHSALDIGRVPHPSVRISLRTKDARGETIALYHSRRASRLS